jgi:hypothetical protein
MTLEAARIIAKLIERKNRAGEEKLIRKALIGIARSAGVSHLNIN